MNLMGEVLRVGQLVHVAEHGVEPETVAFYRDTFDDRNPLYDGSEALAPPLLYHSEVYAHPERWYLKRLVGNLHARQEWQCFAPLRTGEPIRTRSTVVERYRKRARDYVVNEVDYCDSDGRLLVRGRTHQSFLAGDPGAGHVVDRGTAKQKDGQRPAAPEPAEGPELEPVSCKVDLETCWRFSGPGRNYHTDKAEAEKLGFPDVVVQGMLATCLVSQLMAGSFGRGFLEGGRMDLKLVNVVWGGETLRARARVREDQPEGSETRRVVDAWVEKDDEARTVVVAGSASALLP